MKSFQTVFASIALAVTTLASANGFAQAAADMTDGEIRKVDLSTRKVTIRHGDIKNLEMPPMTMVFTAKDPVLLEKFQVGDKVKFHVERENGKMVVTDMVTANF